MHAHLSSSSTVNLVGLNVASNQLPVPQKQLPHRTVVNWYINRPYGISPHQYYDLSFIAYNHLGLIESAPGMRPPTYEREDLPLYPIHVHVCRLSILIVSSSSKNPNGSDRWHCYH